MVGLDPRGREIERLHGARGACVLGRVDFGLGNPQRLRRQPNAIMQLRQIEERCVAAPAHGGDDLGNRRVDIGGGLALVGKQIRELRREIGCAAREPTRHRPPLGNGRPSYRFPAAGS